MTEGVPVATAAVRLLHYKHFAISTSMFYSVDCRLPVIHVVVVVVVVVCSRENIQSRGRGFWDCLFSVRAQVTFGRRTCPHELLAQRCVYLESELVIAAENLGIGPQQAACVAS